MALADPITNPILAQVQAAVNNYSTEANIALEKQKAISEKASGLTDVISKAIADKASADQVIETVKLTEEAKAQNATIETYDAAGGIEFQKELMKSYVATGKKLIAADQAYIDAQKRPTEGVLDYFAKINEVNQAWHVANDLEDKRNDIATTITGINAAQESISRAVATTKHTVNNETIAANNQAIAAVSTTNAAKAKLAGLSTNAEMLSRDMAANATQMKAKIEIYNLHNTEESQIARRKDQEFREKSQAQQIKQWEEGDKLRKVQLEKAELDLKDAKDPTRIAALQAQREKILKDFEDTNKFEAEYITGVQRAQASLGLPVDDPATIKILRTSSAKSKEKFDALYNTGSQEEITYGNTPSQAALNLNKTGQGKTVPVMLLEDLKRGFQNSFDVDHPPPKKAAEAAVMFDEYVAKQQEKWSKNIKEGEATNPYQAPPMPVLIENYANVKDSKLVTNVPGFTDMAEFSPKRIYQIAVAGIAAGQVTPEEAAIGIEGIFKAAVIHNNNSKMFDRIGLNKQTSYRSEIIGPPVFSSSSLGAAGGAGLGVGAVAAVGTAPISVPALIAVGGAAVLGSKADIPFLPGKFPITDNLDRTQILQAITKMISNDESIFGGLF